MATLKCKMCGGDLALGGDSAVAVCEYCGTQQTIPKLSDERKLALFERANYYRSESEFDNALHIYESIIAEEPEEAEAYWGICLCRYGIEYVEDKRQGKRVPTCHRAQYKSILEDPNYLNALHYADIFSREVYQEEAKYIDTVQKGILSISSKEEPYDVFICYKETDDNGNRTIDSVIAQDIYEELTEEGYKVFFAKITLEDRLGIAYEPYIFAALNSAPLMLVVGTKKEYFEAPWVKNEWSRFVNMAEEDRDKVIVPCYRDISVSDMPSEFRPLQSQDVSKVGWLQDLVRGIKKIIPKDNEPKTTEREPQPEPRGKESHRQYEEFLIANIQSFGADSLSDYFPQRPQVSVINRNIFPCVAFVLNGRRPMFRQGEVLMRFEVLNLNGECVYSSNLDIPVNPGNDRLSQVWSFIDMNGVRVAPGAYTARFRINYEPDYFDYSFVVSDVDIAKSVFSSFNTHSVKNTVNFTANQKGKSVVGYLILCIFLGTFGAHSFYIGKKGKGIAQLLLCFTGISSIWMIIDLFKGITKGIPD